MAKKKANGSEKIARQESLEGMEDREIKELETLALDYADVVKERLNIQKQETPLKEALIAKMDEFKRTEYKHNNIHIKLTVTKRKVQVRVEGQEIPESDEAPETEGAVEVSVSTQ